MFEAHVGEEGLGVLLLELRQFLLDARRDDDDVGSVDRGGPSHRLDVVVSARHVILGDVANVDHRLAGKQTEFGRDLQPTAARRDAVRQRLQQRLYGLQQLGVVGVALGAAAQPLGAALEGREVGEYQFGVDGLDVAERVDGAVYVHDVGVVEAANDVGDGGDFNPSPPWIWNAFVSYDNGGFNVTGSWRRFSQGIYNIQRIGPEDPGYDPGIQNSISSNRVEGASYFGLAMSYAIPLGDSDSQSVEIFGSIDNLFDKKPPIAPGGGGGGGSNYPTNPVFFDTFGSRFRAGVRVRY